jgi:hypothetical protein
LSTSAPINVEAVKVLETISKHPNITEERIRGMFHGRDIRVSLDYLEKNSLVIEQSSRAHFPDPRKPWMPFNPSARTESEYRISHLGQRVLSEAWRGR